ncbi:MAG: hypothetical protein QF464_23495, partial [Myxococcota bacterium]|nr:hypothetical protein [Myxococcota bacterium]
LEAMNLPAVKLPTTTVTCVSAAIDCTETLACLGMDPNVTCTSGSIGSSSSCSGNTLVGCEELNNGLMLEKQTDCTQDTSGNIECISAPASSPGGGWCGLATTCTTEGESCDADVVVNCWNAVETRQDCSLTGRTCEVMPSDQPICVVPNATCTTDFCDGNVHVNCEQGFQFIRTDCPALDPDLVCVNDPKPRDPDNVLCAVPAGTEECTIGDATCDVDVARHCTGGKWYDFDCGAFLGGTCEITFGGHARCRAPGLP